MKMKKNLKKKIDELKEINENEKKKFRKKN